MAREEPGMRRGQGRGGAKTRGGARPLTLEQSQAPSRAFSS